MENKGEYMNKLFLTALFIGLLMLGTKNDANAMALFYTNSSYPVTATGSSVKDLNTLKKGSASSNNILFFVEIGDAGIDKAAKNGGINKISYIDVNEKTIFIFWRKVTVTVYGE